MLYKVTPMMAPAGAKKANEPGMPRKKRKTAIYDHEGQEVLITLMCLKCKSMKPLAQFGLRKMADGAIRNQPWCRTCRSGAGTPKAKRVAGVQEAHEEIVAEAEQVAEVAEAQAQVGVPVEPVTSAQPEAAPALAEPGAVVG